MIRSLLVATISLSLAGAAPPILAHHSFAAEYDADQPIKLTGKVARIDLVNPHAWLYIEAPGSDGDIVVWNIEMSSPNSLIRRGITKESVAVGTEVTVEGYRAKDGSNTVNSRTITLGNGEALFSGSSGTGAPGDG